MTFTEIRRAKLVNLFESYKVSLTRKYLGFPLEKAIAYERLRKPFVINDLEKQWDIQGLGFSCLIYV